MQVIVGSGAVGTAVAELLIAQGERVRVVTRSGGGPDHPLVDLVAADAADPAALRRIAAGASVIYNCANPAYHNWPRDWPPLNAAMISAAADNDAVYAITGNLYGYGPVDRPMTEDTPLSSAVRKGRVRAKMWQDALAAPIRTLEARASDYISPRYSVIDMALPAMRAGKTARLPGHPDMPHTYTYVGDVARTLVTLAQDERAWGRAWHVPSPPPMTARDLLRTVARLGGMPEPRIKAYPLPVLRAVALVQPFVREFLEVRYQHIHPFVMDSSRVTETFGLTHTDLEAAVHAVLGNTPSPSPSVASGGKDPSKSTME